LLFENYGQEVGVTSTLVPQPKSWGPVSSGPYGCCAYDTKAGMVLSVSGWTRGV